MMIIDRIGVALCCFALTAPCFAQTRPPDAQTLQEVLAEIRAIHQDLRVTQSTQILLAELEMQQAVANRATENADEARARLLDVQRDQKLVANDTTRAKDRLEKTASEDEKRSLTEEIERYNGNLSVLKVEEQTRTARLQNMEERLKTAQDGVGNLQRELGAIIERMRPASK